MSYSIIKYFANKSDNTPYIRNVTYSFPRILVVVWKSLK